MSDIKKFHCSICFTSALACMLCLYLLISWQKLILLPCRFVTLNCIILKIICCILSWMSFRWASLRSWFWMWLSCSGQQARPLDSRISRQTMGTSGLCLKSCKRFGVKSTRWRICGQRVRGSGQRMHFVVKKRVFVGKENCIIPAEAARGRCARRE